MADDDSEAIDLPLGCWVDSAGYIMLPGGAVIGRVTPQGRKYLDDLVQFAPEKEPA